MCLSGIVNSPHIFWDTNCCVDFVQPKWCSRGSGWFRMRGLLSCSELYRWHPKGFSQDMASRSTSTLRLSSSGRENCDWAHCWRNWHCRKKPKSETHTETLRKHPFPCYNWLQHWHSQHSKNSLHGKHLAQNSRKHKTEKATLLLQNAFQGCGMAGCLNIT